MTQHRDLEEFVGGLKQFRIVRELGRGGMGAVFLAEELRLERLVAIKVLLTERTGDDEAAARFLREARTAAQFSHPNIVSVLHAEEAEGRLYIVMPYVEGDTLAQKIEQRGTLPPVEVAQILREIAWALGYAHGRGIIHRDIKPENVIIERGTGRALVADFGISKNTRSKSLTETGISVGTVHYMSPEQANGGPLSGASDLYSLGVTGYLALTGQYPIDGPSAAAILVRHATEAPQPLRAVSPELPAELATAIDRCLEKDPAHRFPSAESFADALSGVTGQRIAIPPLVRVWIAQSNIVLPILMSLILAMWFGTPDTQRAFFGGWTDISAYKLAFLTSFFAGNGALWFVLYLLIFEPFATRRLLRGGYGLEDIRYGLQAELHQRQEERRAAKGRRSLLRRIVRGVGLLFAAVILFGNITRIGSRDFAELHLVTGGFLFSILIAWYIGSEIGAFEMLRYLRLKIWMGRAGRLLLALASVRLRARGAGPNQLSSTTIIMKGRKTDRAG